MEKFKTAVVALLLLLMLLFAVFFIGRSQFSDGGAASSRISLPAGAIKTGEEPHKQTVLYDRGLLLAEFAAVSFDGMRGGAFGSDVPETIFAFAKPLIHEALSSGATLAETSVSTLEEATDGNFICLRLPSALPYQVIYALTGEAERAAAADTAVSASFLLLSFDDAGAGRLYLADGEVCFVSDAALSTRPAALSQLAENEALGDFRFFENLLPVCDSPVPAFPISVSDGASRQLTEDVGDRLLYLFGFNPDRNDALAAEVVEPHGSFLIDDACIRYTASSDGGISATKLLSGGKDESEIDIYDLLDAAVNLLDRVNAPDPASFGGAATIFLKGVYKDGDSYKIVFGMAYDGIEIAGDAVPYFAVLSAKNGAFSAVEVRRLHVARGALRRTLFPSAWQYAHASRYAGEGGLHNLRLLYSVDALPNEECVASWYCDRMRADGLGAAYAAENEVNAK